MAERILRFHPADKVFHAVNAVTWFALLFTGAAVYFCNLSDETANNLMIWHIWIAVVYTFNLIGYLVFAPHRFAATLNARVVSSRSRSVRLKFRRKVVTTAAKR